MALQYIRQLYSLGTLDTRFVVPSNAPPKEALELAELDPAQPLPVKNGQAQSKESTEDVQPSRWNTFEFKAYGVLISICVFFMFKAVLDVSKESHPNYPKFAHILDDGWIPGRKVDNSDAQYSNFRSNIPYLFLVMLLHPLLRKLYDGFWRADTYTRVRSSGASGLTMGLSPSAAADARLNQRISFDVPFAAIFIIALHGFSAFKILAILYMNYCIAKKLPRPYVPAATWTFGVSILFANEFGKGYSYATIFSTFLPSPPSSEKDAHATNFGHVLDSYGGLNPRWEVLFNFTVLRLISFNMDYYWSLASPSSASSSLEKQLDPSNLPERSRVALPAPPGVFTFRHYFAYTLYAPLYLAGPILTFNDFISQLRYPLPSLSRRRTLLYAVRFAIVVLTMELMIHYMYMVSIFHASERPGWDWSAYTPAQLSMLGFFNLKHIWLKLLIPWRFFRLWGMMDGIDAPENMVRCMSDNYSVTRFWRGWHRSFNLWALRYLFIPLGGSRGQAGGGAWKGQLRGVANKLAVFSFIAIWHDIQLRLLMWGWLVTLFVLPEVVAAQMFPAHKWTHRPDAYRYLCGVGAVGEILLLMVANLVGFALGMDGLRELGRGILSWGGITFLGVAIVALFMASQVMFEWRESEKRRGIRMKC
ncbi:glycerol:H+ symporter-like protein [Bimuria novae-zelandiae CBS 107.79]|uniref:Glycerol:H+ symporter-like protein n=1 Tax=Bimuria novae-zelandiae CBS 107.79 TaxID=1447943 RepID=A0A6A5VVB0_9PLEO|nr:glycerol:H+ symporter-like protein [Bimuria novae-zelandiae CBS 107.79]